MLLRIAFALLTETDTSRLTCGFRPMGQRRQKGMEELSMNYSFLFKMLAGYFAVLIIILLIGIVIWGLGAYGLYCLAKNNGEQEKAPIAFIPAVNQALIGIFVGDMKIFGFELKGMHVAVLLVVLPLLTLVQGIGWIAWILCLILNFYVYRRFYRMFGVVDPIPLTIFSVIFAVVLPIYLFLHRDARFQPVVEEN